MKREWIIKDTRLYFYSHHSFWVGGVVCFLVLLFLTSMKFTLEELAILIAMLSSGSTSAADEESMSAVEYNFF